MPIPARPRLRSVLVAALLLALAATAPAADQPVSGRKLQLRRSASGKETLLFVSKDRHALLPTIGSADDPASGTPGGIQIEIASADEPVPSALSAPPGTGRPGWKVRDAKPDGYRYANPKAPGGASPLQAVVLRGQRLRRVIGRSLPLSLDQAPEWIAVRVTTGAMRICAVFGAESFKRTQAANFLATRAPAPAIPDCSDASLGFATDAVTTTTTTSTTVPIFTAALDFTTSLGTGTCGASRNGASGLLRSLSCGGLNVGSGNSTVAEAVTPDGATNRFGLTACAGEVCSVASFPGSGAGYDCTSPGCPFGPPLPIPNAGTSTCVVNLIAGQVTGTFDLATGETSDLGLQLGSELFLTGNPTQPCPRCSAVGVPGSPGSGTCDRGARATLPCTTTNSLGLSKDCVPGGDDGSVRVGVLPIDLTPLSTGALVRNADAGGAFCPAQTSAGCFPDGQECRTIEENGSPAGSLHPEGTPKPLTLVSIFCIPLSGSPLVDFAASLPGPGADSLVGTMTLRQVEQPSTTTTLPAGATTTTTVVTTTVVTTTTTTTTLAPGTELLDFTTGIGTGACGVTRDGGATPIQAIACSGLDLGGGASGVPEGIIPDGATNRFIVTGCAGSVCTLGPSGYAGGGIDCTDAGCRFGPPLPIPNAGLTVCVVNTFGADGGGSVDKATGALSLVVPLSSHVFLTGAPEQPCPRCSATGTPASPGAGLCDRGARAGASCTTSNSQGLSADCPPGGNDGSADLGSIAVDLTPLVTGSASDTDPAGLFCPGQTTNNDNEGCFGSTACREIEVDGLPAGPLTLDLTVPATLASTFCIPAVGNLLIDGATSLPGPGAASLAGTVTLHQVSGAPTTTTTTTTVSTTTTTLAGSTTTIVTTTTTTTSTVLPPLLPLTVEFASVPGVGVCGSARNGGGTTIQDLDCGDLALGSGTGSLPATTLPDGTVVHFQLGGCSVVPLLTCALDPTTTAGTGFDCTNTGCFFGPPVPIPNAGLSACAVATFAAPASGSVNLLSGAVSANVSLALHVFLTGDPGQPCPRCSASGAPGAVGSGACDRGARAGLSCTTTNSQGLSKDCQPGGSDGSIDVGSVTAQLGPVTTGTASRSNPQGLFCPGQTSAGCFGQASCRSVSETGSAPAAPISSATSPQPATLVSTFCIPATGSIVLDGPAGLPGPAALSLPGQIRSQL